GRWRQAIMNEGDGGHARFETSGISNSQYTYVLQQAKPRQQALSQVALIGGNRGVCGFKSLAPAGRCEGDMPAQISQVFDSSPHARNPFVVLRAGHPAVGQRVWHGS